VSHTEQIQEGKEREQKEVRLRPLNRLHHFDRAFQAESRAAQAEMRSAEEAKKAQEEKDRFQKEIDELRKQVSNRQALSPPSKTSMQVQSHNARAEIDRSEEIKKIEEERELQRKGLDELQKQVRLCPLNRLH
jgi:hypothetical protein